MNRVNATCLWVFGMCLSFGCVEKSEHYEACVQLETARCHLWDRCRSGFDVDQCLYYYHEQCRSRVIRTDFTPTELDSCISAIDTLEGDSVCQQLTTDQRESEICRLDELAACQPMLCADVPESEDATEDEPEDAARVPSGLEPAPQ